MPFIMVLGGVGFMVGTGGSALVAKTLGEGNQEKADRYFTMMVKLTVVLGVLLSTVGFVFIRPISVLLGATDAMIDDCVVYGRAVLSFNTAFMLQNVFQTFLAAAEKPKAGSCSNNNSRYCQYSAGRFIYCHFPMGSCRCGNSNRDRTMCRGHTSAHLFCPSKQQLPAAKKDKDGGESITKGMHKRFV